MDPTNLAKRLADLRPTAVNRVLAEVRQLQAQGRQLVSLMRGQPDTPTPPHVIDAAHQALRAGRTGYPDNQGEPRLREAIARKLARDNQLAYDPGSEILVTDGATQGIAIALGILLQPGDEVLVPEPIYDAYHGPIALWGGAPVNVPAQLRDGRYWLDPDSLERCCTSRTRALLLNTPWNPIGNVLSRTELAAIAGCVRQHNLWLLSDEIYEALVYDGRQHLSPVQVCPDLRARTIVVNSLSKTYGMTGWRVGYCAAPAAVIAAMLLLLQQSSRGPATFVQDAAAAALAGEPEDVRRMTAEFQQRRDLVLARLQGIPGVVPLVPEGGLFVMVDVRGLGRPSDEVRRYLLHEVGVVVIHGAAYGVAGEGTLRVSFAAGGAVLDSGLERLRAGLLRLAAEKGRP